MHPCPRYIVVIKAMAFAKRQTCTGVRALQFKKNSFWLQSPYFGAGLSLCKEGRERGSFKEKGEVLRRKEHGQWQV